ncbi:palmitoyltransferase ZDHHC2-like isoform X2 [Anthonomus grandis grandis]|uniref:palmitoyltransferase ZDHHC2-like isoform X2 n=1 Tax=Anthonomus grandis grandis TaxID=2921223 RepID=UPI002165D5B0|nr:palmitoyltransferase ZDHHC2-like isoform X2 [Anthonomus grandis grandis]
MAHTRNESKGPCFWCFKAVKWIPVLIIITIVAWSYYAYVVQLCLVTVESIIGKIFYLLFYHIFFLMFCWSYAQTIFTDIGKVPSNFKLSEADYAAFMHHNDSLETQYQILQTYSNNLPITNVTVGGGIRFCEKCRVVKPDRTHHCSVCGECVLKMDHHCPWINNCVCFTNYKFFLLFLAYALIYCLYICLTSLPYFIAFWRNGLQGMARFHILFLFFIAVMFGVSLMSLFIYHCYLVLENRTTLEAFRPPSFREFGADKYGFHLGRYRNFKEVFGEDPKSWFLPISTSLGDGVQYPIHSKHLQTTRHSVDNSRNSLGDGVAFPILHLDEDQEGLLRGQHMEEDECTYP